MSQRERGEGEAPAPWRAGRPRALLPGASTRTTARSTATAIGKGIERSAGAVSNCLARLAKEQKVRQAKRKPRAYVVKEAK